MSYVNARARIATVLATVAITSPIEETIRKVYDDPPGAIQDVPCFILMGAAGNVSWMMGGGAQAPEHHAERVRLLVRDQDHDRAVNIVRAYRQALITAFASEGGLNGNGVIEGLAWEEPYGNNDLAGQDFLFTFNTV